MPRAGLSAAHVVARAGDLADRDGLDAVTLAVLAGDLGVRTPSLYSTSVAPTTSDSKSRSTACAASIVRYVRRPWDAAAATR